MTRPALDDKHAVQLQRSYAQSGASRRTVSLFRRIIYGHYKEHGRHGLPWRHTDDPYCIFVSEVMLQQTQVERVVSKYGAFLEAFPDFRSLADAPIQSIYRQWQGLGYNRRALTLQKAAQKVIREFPRSELTDSVEVLATLPGIGAATASAIAAFAFNKPSVFIETNIRRVFLHFFFRHSENVHDRELLPLVERALDRNNPRIWYSALMDYGSMLKKIMSKPNRTSAHYQKQPPFEGSDRQARGAILRTLLRQGSMTEKRLFRLVNVPPHRGKPLLDKLMQEGFLKKQRGIFRLA